MISYASTSRSRDTKTRAVPIQHSIIPIHRSTGVRIGHKQQAPFSTGVERISLTLMVALSVLEILRP